MSSVRLGEGRDRIGVGLWEMQDSAWPRTLERVGVSRETSLGWFRQSFAVNGRSRAGRTGVCITCSKVLVPLAVPL